MNIFDAIRKDHEKQRTLVKLLAKTHGDSDGREELYSKLKAELEKHAVAEERHFYVPLMEKDLTQEKARHGVAEHHELDELIAELDKTDRSSSGWLTTAKKLEEKLIHHLDEEEQEIFQLAGKVLDEGEKKSFASEYIQEMESQGDQ